MLEGSSAFYYESEKQITTPRLMLTMKENLTIRHDYRTTGFSSKSPVNSKFQGFFDSCIFNNYLIVAGTTDRDVNGAGIQTHSMSGVSEGYTFCLGHSPFHVSFLNTGETLDAFYTVTGPNMFCRISSNNGTSWSGLTILAGLTPISGFLGVRELIALGGSDIYFRGLFTSALNRLTFPNGGATYRVIDYDDVQGMDGVIFGVSTDYGAMLVYEAVDNDTYPVIRKIETDGVNVFSKENLFDEYPGRGEALLSWCKGSSLYYLHFAEITYYKNYITGGVTYSTEIGYDPLIIRTDGKNFDRQVLIGISTYTFTEDVYPAIVPGTSSNQEFLLFNYDGNYRYVVEFRNKNQTVDVSDDVISYFNRNNERISLTLGNFK